MDEIETTIESTLLIIRPGDVLFVMPTTDQYWTESSREKVAAIVKAQLPEARIIVLPCAATFVTVAVEDARLT